MMDVTGKLIDGVVGLTKLMAHGAMHEACLIEVIKTTEEEAFQLVYKIRNCVNGNQTYNQEYVDRFIEENNATVIDVDKREPKKDKHKSDKPKSDVNDIIRRMLAENNDELQPSLKQKLAKLQSDLGSMNTNLISKETNKGDK
ncbi:uncharacterized protein LOC114358277 [Ostrinia furnacalis]|uniref:uncharacterized protein LOC114358277 n=1 Tax=Ostrinia furnacalis TaxID=93504 RepID=UPI00103E523B|nr:uncharacterized protein LOC114358277 [Ostrinia furnacalis]